MIELQTEQKNNVIIIHVSGELFFGNIDQLEELWNGQVSKQPETIAVNCRKLVSIDSTVIGYFVKFLKESLNKKINLVFYDLNSQVNKLFLTARLDKFFTITTKNKFETEYFV